MTSLLQPYREPLRTTLVRTSIIAICAGALLARSWGGLRWWPLTTLLAFWPSFGGHWLEVWFLNWLRPRLSGARGWQQIARLVVWFAGGAAFIGAMALTLIALGSPQPRSLPVWWLGGLGFVGIELVVHLAMQAGGRPNFYNQRG